MPAPLSGPGLGLQIPQALYPTALANAPLDTNTNKVCLNAGDELQLPSGDLYVSLGSYLVLEFLDPVTGIWTIGAAAAWNDGIYFVKSDGFNVRVANRLGCPIGGVIIAPGSGYVQASTTVSVIWGGSGAVSTWLPIVGGQLVMNTSTIVTANAGAGYGVPPIVMIPSPPPGANNPNGVGGIAASGYATIASGTVSGFTFTNPGAGYTGTTFNAVCLPNPTDPNLATGITLGTITFSVTASGSLTGLLCTNPGNPLPSGSLANISLTVSGAGSSGSVNPVILQTVTAASVVGGSTLANAQGSLALVTTVGGAPPQGTFTNSEDYLYLRARPRPAQIGLTLGGTGTLAAQVGAIYDGGLFFSAPVAILATTVLQASATTTGQSTLSLTMGQRPDVAVYQSAP
jgi:hypothetical protein